MKALIL